VEAKVNFTKNFSLAEFTRSQTATRHGYDNTPPKAAIAALERLCMKVLQPLRDLIQSPIIVTSGYRSPSLNYAVGGSETSQHCLGQAADIYAIGISTAKLFDVIRKSGLPYDQVILENPSDDGWVHVSYRGGNHDRYQALIAHFAGRKVTYTFAKEVNNATDSGVT
jgi:zinc D-Ala-D-Ala carboxypeptidase